MEAIIYIENWKLLFENCDYLIKEQDYQGKTRGKCSNERT